MAWSEIECVKPVAGLDAVSDTGVRVKARKFKRRNGAFAYWIELTLGRSLAKALKLPGELGNRDQAAVRLMFGMGEDAGKIGITCDVTQGKFMAKRSAKRGTWSIAIGAASCDGLFALEFPTFAVDQAAVLAPAGKPPIATFAASPEMLAVAD